MIVTAVLLKHTQTLTVTRVVLRGLNYESGLKRQAGLNLKAIDNGPKMVTMDRDYTKVRAEPRA